jgi:hypothetical protein
MTREEGFDPKHVNVEPGAKRPVSERAASAPELATVRPA